MWCRERYVRAGKGVWMKPALSRQRPRSNLCCSKASWVNADYICTPIDIALRCCSRYKCLISSLWSLLRCEVCIPRQLLLDLSATILRAFHFGVHKEKLQLARRGTLNGNLLIVWSVEILKTMLHITDWHSCGGILVMDGSWMISAYLVMKFFPLWTFQTSSSFVVYRLQSSLTQFVDVNKAFASVWILINCHTLESLLKLVHPC
jgi:hypothetical protein